MTWDVEIKEYHAIANWTWDAGDDVCSICRMPFDGCPPDCKVHSCVNTLAALSRCCRCCTHCDCARELLTPLRRNMRLS